MQVIHIPGVRPVADYACNEAALAVRGPSIRGDVAAAPYVRYQEVLPGVYDEHQVAEYDMSSEDEAFLRKLNGQVGAGAAEQRRRHVLGPSWRLEPSLHLLLSGAITCLFCGAA